jgi:methylase of polypeptide subunit release factors
MPKMPLLSEEQLPDANKHLDVTDRVQRQDAAVAMKIAGAAYSEIAKAMDYRSADDARLAVERALASSVNDTDRERLRFLEARRLERLLRSLWRKATDEADPEQLPAIRTALALIDRHARLYGLDAPTEMVVYTPSRLEIERFVASVSETMNRELPTEADIVEGEVV